MHTHILPTLARLALALLIATAAAGCTVLAAAEPKPTSPPSKDKEFTSPEQIDKLIRELGNKDYYTRQRAQDELARLGFEALEALDAATTNDDLEIASRAKYLLRLMRIEWTAEDDPVEVKNCLANYENMDGRSREARMLMLARLPDSKGVAALCRLVRFERSSLLSKTAAAALLYPGKAAEPPSPAAVQIIRKTLQHCKRPGAAWLLAWTRLPADPKTALADWAKLFDAELTLFDQSPEETSSEIITRLTRCQVAWLKKLGKNDEAVAAIRRLIALDQDNPQVVADLLAWLIEQKSWTAVDDLAKRFAPRFAADPALLYSLAQSYADRSDKQRAEATAQRAFRLHPGKQDEQLILHYTVAQQLRNRGQFDWARREYEYVIAQAAAEEQLSSMSRIFLSRMLHEQGQDLDAAAVLEKLVKGLDAGKIPESSLYGSQAKEIRALRHYLTACHWAANNDIAKQRAALDKALAADPDDLDSLIACYRLPDQSPEFHAKIVRSIKDVAEKMHEMIAADPRNPAMYNQYAWLVGNTEGDFDEALRCSLKSVELRPEEGSFYDTLAHVYFGKGDYENAVKYQTRATELERHSEIIKKKLEVFRKKLAEKKQK